MENNEIHHPDHYNWKGMECKDVISIMTRGLWGSEAYYVGNIIKYLYRYPQKGTPDKDLAKASEYIDMLRRSLVKKEEDKENWIEYKEGSDE